jgi:type I restriction enzyme S subunit
MGNVSGGRITGVVSGFVKNVDPGLLLESGDLLFNRTNSLALVGKVGLFEGAEMPTTFASYLVRLRVHPGINPRFLNFLLNTEEVLGLARSSAFPSIGQANLNPTRYTQLRIWLPTREIQDDIADALDAQQTKARAVALRSEALIDRLLERKQTMITAAVTGQLDISTAA